MSDARYAVGIDLGTTHCVMAAVDTAERARRRWCSGRRAHPAAHRARGGRGTADLLPSFLYLPHPSEFAPGDLNPALGLQKPPFVVGELARMRMGGRTPIRLVASAKSWLCHPGVDRRAAILPADAPAEVERVSPLMASMRYLTHLRDAWNQRTPTRR
jgi:molecular chaperone DnaK (HSP70)